MRLFKWIASLFKAKSVSFPEPGPIKLPDSRENRQGRLIDEQPSKEYIPVQAQPEIPKDPNIYPRNLRFEADPDIGGEMKPEIIVIHHTASYHTNSTVEMFKRQGVDVHFVIGHNGEVIQMAPANRKCAHAGASEWAGRKSLNNCSIGIEVVNIGQLYSYKGQLLDCYEHQKMLKKKPYTYWTGPVRRRDVLGHQHWEPFTERQEEALIDVCLWAMESFGIEAENVIGHFMCSPGRKVDPAGGLSFESFEAFQKHLKSLYDDRGDGVSLHQKP